MTVPSVNITIQDGSLGVTSTGSSACAVIGVSSTGPLNLPTACTKVQTLTDTFGVGPGVEAAATIISTGVPVLFIRAETASEGDRGMVTQTGTGTVVATTDISTTTPLDKYEIYIEFTTAGTIGADGIKYRYSYDGGRSMSPAQSLGTLTAISIPNCCDVNLAAGDIEVGDTISFRTVEPGWDGTTLLPALQAYKLSAVRTRLLHVVGAISATGGGIIDQVLDEMQAMNKPRRWIGSARIPNDGEDAADYLIAMTALRASYSTKRGALCSGAADIVSAVSGRQYLRPISYRVAAEEARQIQLGNEEVDIADVNLGSLIGTSILDTNGNPKHWDEFTGPGLDDLGFITLRTWPTFAGCYVTNPRLFSPAGSDYQFIPHGLIMDISQEVAYQNLALRLNQPVLVDKTTGYIYEADALEIEAGCTAALSAVLLSKPKASSVEVFVSRTDDILATNTLNVTIRIVPLAYITRIDVTMSFLNPAIIAA